MLLRYLRYLFDCYKYRNSDILSQVFKPCTYKQYKLDLKMSEALIRRVAEIMPYCSIEDIKRRNEDMRLEKEETTWSSN